MRDMVNVYAAGTKRRLLIGCISTLVGIPIVGCCLVLLAIVVFPELDKLVAGGNGNTGMLVMLGIGLVIMVGLIAIPLVALFFITRRRARALDAIFTPLGLTGGPFMINGRHYQGQINGREVDVYIYRGPTVEIRVQAAVQTNLLVVRKGSLPTSVAWIFDKQPLATNDPALNAFSIFPLDKAWTSTLLAEASIGNTIQTLMTLGAAWAIFRRVEIQPGSVTLYLYRSHNLFGNSMDLDAAQAWLKALGSLAQVAESQPAPEVTAQPVNAASRQARQKKSSFLVYAVLALVFIMPVCFIAIGVAVYLVVPFIR
jgi:hypothetical protein